MQDIAAKRAAETLLAEHNANSTFKPLGPPDRPATISDAYDIQERFVTLLRGKHGDAVGYKVGLTSTAMQTFCGIDHPIAGVVLARRVVQSGATVRRPDFGRLGLEFEIAVRIKSDIPVAGMPWSTETIAPSGAPAPQLPDNGFMSQSWSRRRRCGAVPYSGKSNLDAGIGHSSESNPNRSFRANAPDT